jgi:proline iminopeptidase
MRTTLVVVLVLAQALFAVSTARESRVPVSGGAHLFARDIGRGEPILILHGGPDFDHTYLLPDFDRLSTRYRLIYYDQRGRGRSADGVRPDDVSMASDVEDVERVREHFGLKSATVLGHSWGTVLALEYALKHPRAVSRIILMNPAPASAADYARFREFYVARQGPALDRLRAIAATDEYKRGDPEAVGAYYRIHFAPAFARAENLDRLLTVMQASFASTDILKARAVEQRLYEDTWQVEGYDLMPKLLSLRMPALVVLGDHDFIPADVGEHIARSMAHARLVTLEHCGHFPYLECPQPLQQTIDSFFREQP